MKQTDGIEDDVITPLVQQAKNESKSVHSSESILDERSSSEFEANPDKKTTQALDEALDQLTHFTASAWELEHWYRKAASAILLLTTGSDKTTTPSQQQQQQKEWTNRLKAAVATAKTRLHQQTPSRHRNPHSSDEQQIQKSNELSEVLEDSVQRMRDEVVRSRTILSAFEASTSDVQKTRQEYSAYQSVLKSCKSVVGKLRSRDVSDRILLGLGWFIFLLTLVYIIARRIF